MERNQNWVSAAAGKPAISIVMVLEKEGVARWGRFGRQDWGDMCGERQPGRKKVDWLEGAVGPLG